MGNSLEPSAADGDGGNININKGAPQVFNHFADVKYLILLQIHVIPEGKMGTECEEGLTQRRKSF